MKKLLALILCIVMVLSLVPAAFAADDLAPGEDDEEEEEIAPWYLYPFIDNPLNSVAAYSKDIKDMIKNTRENIQTAYGVLAMDQAVYSASKSMDDIIVGLVDGIAKKLIDDGKMTRATSNTVKTAIRLLIDEKVATEMAKDYKYLNSDGEIVPEKYAAVYVKAVSDALTDKKFVKGYEAVATYFALRQVVSDINDELEKKYEDFANSVDSSFDKNFADRYPMLAENYVTSFTQLDENLAAALAGLDDDATAEEIADALDEVYEDTMPWAVQYYGWVELG
jgi:hypothetical protein